MRALTTGAWSCAVALLLISGGSGPLCGVHAEEELPPAPYADGETDGTEERMPEGLIAAATRNEPGARPRGSGGRGSFGARARKGPPRDGSDAMDSDPEDSMDVGYLGDGLGDEHGRDGPTLEHITLSPSTVSVVAGPANVTLEVDFTVSARRDDVHGATGGLEDGQARESELETHGDHDHERDGITVDHIHAAMESKDHPEQVLPCIPEADVSATPYRCHFSIPKHAAKGEWFIREVSLHDSLGRSTHIPRQRLLTAGHDVSVQVESEPDSDAPILTHLELRTERGAPPPAGAAPAGLTGDDAAAALEAERARVQSHVDPADGMVQYLVVSADISDAQAGFVHGEVRLLDPRGEPAMSLMFAAAERTSGDARRGTYVARQMVHPFAAGGKWQVQEILLADAVLNERKLDVMRLKAAKLPRTVNVETAQDTEAPVVSAVSIREDVVAPGSLAHIIIEAEDNAAGIAHVVVRIGHPALQHDIVDGEAPMPALKGAAKVDITARIPRLAPEGEYPILEVIVIDDVNNQKSLSNDDLKAAGFPNSFHVRRPTAQRTREASTQGRDDDSSTLYHTEL